MGKSEFIANRLQEVLLDGFWIANTNFKQQITAVDRKQATHKIGNLNTIAALTFHINYYLGGILKVFEGGQLEISDKFSFDLPEMTSESDWKNLVDEFVRNSQKFIEHVSQMTDTRLESTFVDPKYGSYLRNIEGVIEHSYYHLGQVVLIRKMILEKTIDA